MPLRLFLDAPNLPIKRTACGGRSCTTLGAVSMGARYRLRLMFDWGGGAIWCGNDSARARFDVGPIEDALPLSRSLKLELSRLSEWHDKALDWDDPAGPSPWTDDEFATFEAAALAATAEISEQLGPEYEVVYEQLGR